MEVHHVQVRHQIPNHVTEVDVITEEPRCMVDAIARQVGQEPAASQVSKDYCCNFISV